ncbi:hypothetical protein F7725_002029 [Dissostichus mawsoni]|uniref:Immunoglobulin domain-containing protein n=1 Tax=Dissostichus mawsoni TaxID=36200 RepID=A0A7J5Y1H8_DISMA|nr:hypothetical protein F7725_002029 [Dissostichus mawsoni]
MARRYFLTYFTLTSCLGQSPEYALQGGEVSLKPDFTGHPDGILWKHKGNKVVEFNGREEQFYKPFENRITLDWISADIQITDLRFEDSGEYELELELNKKLQRFLYQLEVIDKIAKPIISCEINDDSIVNISGKLLCSAKPGRLQSVKKFEWRSHGSVQPGPEFNIPLGGEHNEEEYSCTVSNPRSNETATFTAKDCYPGSNKLICRTDCGLVSFFFIFLLVALPVMYCKLRNKACFAKDDPEKQSRVVPKKGSKKTASPRSPLPAFSQDQNNLGDEDADREHLEEKIQLGKATNSEEAEPNPADVSDVPKNNTEEHEKTASPPSPRHNESPSLDQSNVGAEDADQHRELAEEETHRSTTQTLRKKIQTQLVCWTSRVRRRSLTWNPLSFLSSQVWKLQRNTTDEHEKTMSPPFPQNNLGAEDADQHRELAEEETPQVNNSDSEREDPDPAVVTDVPSEETQSDLESSIVPEQPEKNTDQHEKTASPPSPTHSGQLLLWIKVMLKMKMQTSTEGLQKKKSHSVTPQTPRRQIQPAVVTDVPSEESRSDLESSDTEHTEPEKKDDKAEGMQSAPASAETFSPAQPPEDSTFGHKEDANSQVTKETKEKNVRESDSSGEEERNESDDSTEDEQSPTLPEHKGLETTLHEQDLKAAEEETHTSKDNQQEVSETVKPVSEDGNKTESVGDCKETDKEPDLHLATSQQSQSPTPSNTFQESPDTAGAEPDQEEEEQKGHDKSKVQSDKDKGDVVEDKHEVECGLKEEKPGNESLSENEEEQKKDKVVA